MTLSVWQPPVDIFHRGTYWFVKVELAGVRPDQLSISASDNVLSLRGSRKDVISETGCSYHALEISYCNFARRLVLPVLIDTATLAWEYSNGMLLIRFHEL